MFKDKDHQKQFDELGYIVLPLLNDDKVNQIERLYHDTKSQSDVNLAFFTSIWSKNKDYRSHVDTQLKELLTPEVEKLLVDFQTVFANFMVKNAGEDSALQPHQDWTFVDEKKYDSITIWIPLIDVDEYNGALGVCPRSHMLKNHIRPRFDESPFSDYKEQINEELIKTISMRAGSALLVNSRLIHASNNNLSGHERISCSIVVAPRSADLVHYVVVEENQDDVFKLNINSDFFVDYSCFEIPHLENAEKFPFKKNEFSFQFLESIVLSESN